MQLDGRIAVVTGGSRGIGFEICKLFLQEGAKVLAVSRSSAKLDQAKASLPGLEVMQGDMSVGDDIKRVVDSVTTRWGHVDLLINNAGISPEGGQGLVEQSDQVFEEALRVNTTGVYLCTKGFLPLLLKSDDPRIANLGSTSGILSPRLSGAYAVSKAALHALTIAWANELAGKVPVNAMSPGWVRTDMSPNAPGDPQDSAATALWLVTQDREMTGQFVRDKASVGWMPLDIVEQVAALNRQVSERD